MLVEGRLEPHVAQAAAGEPFGRELSHLGDDGARIDVGRAEQLERPGGAAALRQHRPFQHHRASIGARHIDVGGVRARVDPGALARPAEAGRSLGRPAGHRDDAVVDLQTVVRDEPVSEFAQRHAVAHRHRPRANEAFPAGQQREPFHRPARRVRAIQHPHGLAVPCRRFQHVEQRGDEGVDAAADILEIDEHDIERVHRRVGRAADFAIEAEHRHAILRIGEVRRLHHVVLQVPAHAVLWAEHRRDGHAGRDQRVEAVGQIRGDRGGMRKQGHALVRQRGAKIRFGEKTIDSEKHVSLLAAVGRQSNRDRGNRAHLRHVAAPNRIWCRPVPRLPR